MKEGFGVETLVSEEPGEILDTGGGLLHAARFIERDAPFFLHNVDVLTDVALRPMYEFALESDALVVLAVRANPSERYLLFDDAGLCGFGNAATDSVTLVREHVGEGVRRGFTGIHVVSPRIFDLVTERGAFSIITLYARLAAAGHAILPYPVDDATWIDIGTPERLAAANQTIFL
jgi:NDP-sugar pyrophosphorylase family protein